MINLWIQGIGVLAFLSIIYSFQLNRRHKILLFIWIGQALFVMHFGLLGAYTAAAMNIVAAWRTYLFDLRGVKPWAAKRYWLYIFITLFIITGFLTWEGYHSLLPIVAQIIESFAMWSISPKKIRIMMLIPRPFWFVYNYIVGSYAGMASEVLVSGSIASGIMRFDHAKVSKHK